MAAKPKADAEPKSFGDAITWMLDWMLLASFRENLKMIRAFNELAERGLVERAPDPVVVASAAPKPLTEAEIAAMGEKAKGVLSEILKRMGIEASVQVKINQEADEIVLEVVCDDSGLLIGRKGQTLEALQYLVTRIARDRQGSEGPHILVDIENYRQRRKKSLEDMALRLGDSDAIASRSAA